MNDLVARTALVTGASRGIGRATARALARAGARVLVHYGNSAKDADSLVAEIREAGGSADAVGADLSAPDGAHELAAEVRKLVGGARSIFWWLTQGSRFRPRSKLRPYRTSTGCSRSTYARRFSSCSNSCR